MDEEVQRVFDALAGLADIADPKARALAVAKVLKDWPEHSKRLREVRRQAVLELLAPEEASVRKVAKELGVSPSTVQDIAGGHSRWEKRPKTTTNEESQP
jgi:DNA invertase Pin-like site-specific DNA recombinase